VLALGIERALPGGAVRLECLYMPRRHQSDRLPYASTTAAGVMPFSLSTEKDVRTETRALWVRVLFVKSFKGLGQ
jgi:hypothetical protein